MTCQYRGCTRQAKAGRKYCSDEHMKYARDATWKVGKAARDEIATVTDIIAGRSQELPGGKIRVAGLTDQIIDRVRRQFAHSPLYERLLTRPDTILLPLLAGRITQEEAGVLLGTTQKTVSRILVTFADDVRTLRLQDEWSPDPAHILMLLPQDARDHWDRLEPSQEAEVIDDYVERLIEFGQTFLTDEDGRPMIYKGFHRRWMAAIIRAFLERSRQGVLSPPRHGKTQLLITFCLWLLVSWPNIRIGWVSYAQEVAGDWLDAIKGELEENRPLRDAYLPPGRDWRPDWRSSLPWSKKKFSIATRTLGGTALKSPTMQAIGAGGTLNSKDFDIVVADDVDDLRGNFTTDQQEKVRRWFGQTLTARKMGRTSLFYIGSRQGEDDLGARLIENSEWSMIVDSAHDDGCELDPFSEEIHLDCMLFPELFPYSLLMSRQRELEGFGGKSLWAMIYQNKTLRRGGLPYKEEAMNRCRNFSRRIGQYPPNTLLVAGLDPAPVNTQAAFLWGYQPDESRLYVIDIETIEAAGIQGVRAQVAAWFEAYQLRRWVLEETGWQSAILRDEILRDYRTRNGILIEPHETQGYNKWDPRYGVAARGELYETTIPVFDDDGNTVAEVTKVDLPYGDLEAQFKIDAFIEQAKRWNPAAVRGRRSQGKSDMLMAQWFPFKVLDQWAHTLEEEEAELDYEPFFADYPMSTIEDLPW